MILECPCGTRHPYTAETTRVDCDCGAVYAVAITELRPSTAA